MMLDLSDKGLLLEQERYQRAGLADTSPGRDGACHHLFQIKTAYNVCNKPIILRLSLYLEDYE